MDPETKEELMKKSEKRSRSRSRGRRSRSKSRSRRYSRSRSISPYRGGGGGRFRGINNRFNRRSPFRRNFRDRFRRSRSTSRGRFDRKERRRYDSRRSKSGSPSSILYGQQQQQLNYSNDAYNSYIPNAPQAPQFSGQMAQFNSYDFQASYPPPAPTFNMNQGMLGNIVCPAPPGMGENWIPPQNMQPQNETEEERIKRDAAIAEEKKRHREGLIKQRNQCKNRSERMERELKQLKQQKADFLASLGKRSPSPKSNNIIKEIDKLKSQISTKLKETLNIIEMLDGIIKKDSDDEDEKESTPQRKSESDDTSPERIKKEILKSLDRKRANKEMEEKKVPVEKFNYILYDPELHWCKHCQVFPASAKEYLNHLHTKEHLEKIANRATDAPWRASFQKQSEVPSYPDAPTKRAPIKGLQFFEPSTAWFCKLCDVFMGDSWCVSLHLKSEIHAERYNKLLEREPKFEEKWLEARKKALELTGKSSGDNQSIKDEKPSSDKTLSDKKSKKKKNKKDTKKKRKHSKKRKRGSSSSSSSSNSEDNSSSSESESSSRKNDSDQVESKNSIRVAMRNLLNKTATKENDERTGKWTMVPIDSKPKVPPAPTISQHAAKEIKNDEKFIGQWNTVEPVISQEEKRLVENLKGKFKSQQKKENTSEKTASVSRRDEAKSRSRSRDRNRSDRNYRSRYSRSRSNSRGRRSRTRSNSRDRRFRRYSRSRSRDRNSRSRYGRPAISFPSEPRPPVKEEKLPTRSYISTVKKDESSTSSSGLNAAKRMPFIGKMPVFKKQLVEKKNEDQSEEKKSSDEENQTKKAKTEEVTNDEKWDELMPDPLQFSAMMNANVHQKQLINEEVPDAPPGLDPELDSDLIPKPISDAPILREGPLPKDFQATLDLLFDGDKPKPVVIEPSVPEIKPEPLPVVNTDGPQMILPEELSQHAMLYGNYYQQTSSAELAPVPPPPPINLNNTTSNDEEKIDDKNISAEIEEENGDKTNKNQEDMDDLAMLGIDVNDVGSGFW